jgi:hypothetical protein
MVARESVDLVHQCLSALTHVGSVIHPRTLEKQSHSCVGAELAGSRVPAPLSSFMIASDRRSGPNEPRPLTSLGDIPFLYDNLQSLSKRRLNHHN